MEKENIARLVMDVLFLVVALCSLIVSVIEHWGAVPLIISGFFVLVFILASFAECYECIFYDDTHFFIRSLAGNESIEYSKIEKIKREYIREKTARGGGHWRYSVQIKNQPSSKTIIVPFPQMLTNEHLADLFQKIKLANPAVIYINI